MSRIQDRQVIVLTRNYSTGLSVIRSLGVAGFPVDLIASVPKEGACEIAAASKYVNRYVEVVSKKVKEETDDPELIREIMKYAGQYDQTPILFPTDDYTTAVMDTHRSELAPYFLMPTIKNGGDGDLARLMDKSIQTEMAKAVGMSVPQTWKISLWDENITIPADMVYPCYCKPIRSIEGYKTEMAVCENANDLKAYLQMMRSRFAHRDVLVQEYLHIDRETEVDGACLYDRVIIPAMICKTRIGKYARGVTLTGQMVPFEELGADMTEKVVALMRSFGYHGTFDMEFNIVGDKVYFSEVNLRSSGDNHAYFKSGINLPLLYVKSLLGEQIDPAEERMSTFGQTMIYDKVAWDDCIHGFLSREELDECLKSADIKILCDEDDPVPGKLFTKKNLEDWEREEKKRRLQQSREECIGETVRLTGWDEAFAKEQIKDARERLGISYSDYRKHEFGLIPIENQEEAYKKILKDRERKKQRKECIESAMAKNGWDEEFAKEQLSDARKRLGISYKDYQKYEFYAIPMEQQAEAYDKIRAKKERLRKQKEECISAVMEQTKCNREDAVNFINDARSRLGISYKDYKKFEFWSVPIEKQQAAYEKIVSIKGGENHGK